MDISAVVEGINAKAASAPPLGSTLKIDFGEQQVHVDGTGDKNVVTASDADADCVISVTTENFMKLVNSFSIVTVAALWCASAIDAQVVPAPAKSSGTPQILPRRRTLAPEKPGVPSPSQFQ